MANVPSLIVDDTSPIIQYFPFSDTLSTPNFTAGWNPLFNQTSLGGDPLQVESNSTTVHVTSLNNASFSLQWQGTGIQLFGSATDANYSILVDGSPQVVNSTDTLLASIQNLDDASHVISLTTIISNTIQNQTQSFIVFDKAVISAPPTSDNSSTYIPQPLNDTAISFHGEWSFQNKTSISLTPIHISSSLDDSASTGFNGTALQIFGQVSPDGGNYTVQLDNTTAHYSAKASFIQNDTLLFSIGALDPTLPHNVEIINNGGTLILPVGGFLAFSSGNPNLGPSPATPSPTPSIVVQNDALSKGAIAALALAGILAFLLISSLLFCIFVWRPRKIRQRQARREQRKLERFANDDTVLDIGRHTSSFVNNSPAESRGSQKSVRSGFLRWKRDLESGNGGKMLGALGLVFRHSNSPKDKEPAQIDEASLYGDEALSAKSSLSSPEGKKDKGKAKAKSPWSRKSKSYSPSYTVDLPSLSRSQELLEQQVQHPTSFSGLTSLTYLSTTPDTETYRRLSFNAPSSHFSGSSLPHPPNHGRTDSNGVSVVHERFDGRSQSESGIDYRSSVVSTHQEPENQVYVQEIEVQSTNATSSRGSRLGGESGKTESTRPSQGARDVDRGSVRTNDDALSVLGPATARAAIRGLSPRTSELAFTNLILDHTTQKSEDAAPRERLISDETLRPDNRAPLGVRSSSPFHVDFVQLTTESNPKAAESGSRKSTGFSVRFEDDDPTSRAEDKGKGPAIQESDKLLVPTGRPPGPKASFRLTPLRPVASSISEVDTIATTSFLDLSGSNSNSDSSQKDPSLASHGREGLKSRWSATTGTDIGSHNIRSSVSGSGSGASVSYPFPFPVSLPASPHHPEGFKPSPPATPLWEPESLSAPSGRLDVHLHPFGTIPNPTSPSDSVPMSISDLHFRHSDSENDEPGLPPAVGTSSHLPPHPPLPTSVPPTPTFPPPVITSLRIDTPSSAEGVLSTPSYIVNRVFTHGRSGSDLLSPPPRTPAREPYS